MSHDVLLYLDDIAEACGKVRDYVRGVSREQLLSESMRFDAVVHNLAVIGEAARQLPDDVRQALSDHPWGDIVAMRNIPIHKYFNIDPDVVWSVASTEVEPLGRDVRAYLGAQDDSRSAQQSESPA